MADKALRVALIGAGGFGAKTLAALSQAPLARIVGLADRDSAVARAAAEHIACPAYDDDRRLLAEQRPQVVFLALPPALAVEAARLAISFGCHVWMEGTPGRNLPEAVALCRQADEARLKLAVGTQRRFMSGYRQAHEWRAKLGAVHLVQARYLYNQGGSRDREPMDLGWHGDRSAGGGAWIELGFHVLDLLTWLVELPDSVFTLAGRHPSPSDKPQRIYDSDDSASAVVNFGGRRSGTITVSRRLGPITEGMTLHGERGTLIAGPDSCLLLDADGATLGDFSQPEPPGVVLARQAESFLLAVACEAKTYECSAREALLAMAAVEAGYLSNRTGQSESPVTLLSGFELKPEMCLEYARAASKMEHD